MVEQVVGAGGRRYDTVTLLTDYGTADEFVGVLKSVLRDLAPHVTTVDLTHDIPPFDVRAGALCLGRAVGYLPEGVVVAVVDPGVGTARRPIAVEVAGGAGVFVGPDNGLLAPAVALVGGAERAVVLDDVEYHLEHSASTFDGRDVFAPVAAHLCNGVDLAAFGNAVDPASLMPAAVPLPDIGAGVAKGQVLWVDHYGNCQLNVGPDELDAVAPAASRVRITFGDGREPRTATRVTAFAELGPSAIGLVADAYGMLALALDRRSAAIELALDVGDEVTLEAIPDDERAAGASTRVQLSPRP